MIDKSSLLKSQGSLYLEFIPKDGLFHKMLLLTLMGFLTGWCNLEVPTGWHKNYSCTEMTDAIIKLLFPSRCGLPAVWTNNPFKIPQT